MGLIALSKIIWNSDVFKAKRGCEANSVLSYAHFCKYSPDLSWCVCAAGRKLMYTNCITQILLLPHF